MKPAILYAAKSTKDEKGSIPDQLADSRKLAAERGLEIVGEPFKDENKSAYHGDRGDGLTAAMAECERLVAQHGSCALIVQHSDRLARGNVKDARHLIEIVVWAIKTNVELLSVQDPATFTDDDDVGLLLSVIGGMRNHQDSKRKSLAVKDGARRRVQRGLHHGRPPYGYRAENGKLVIEHAEAAVIGRIFRQFAEEGLSQREIARRLNRDGIRAQRGDWTQGTVSKTLRSPVYAGRVVFHGEALDGTHEAIVSEELWQKAKQVCEANTRTRRGRTPTANHLLAGGMLRCRCGASMYAESRPPRGNGVAYEAYTCSRRHLEGLDACDQMPVKRKPIDEAIWRFVTETALDLEATKRAITAQTSGQIVEVSTLRHQAEQEVAKIEMARAKIERDYLHGDLPATDYRAFRDRLAAEHDAATASVAALTARHDRLVAEAQDVDAEGALLFELAAIRAEILGQARESEHAGTQALRTALRRLFNSFELVPVGRFPVAVAEGIIWPQDRSIQAGDYWLLPHVRPEAIDREAWVLRRQPLPLSGSDAKSLTR